MEGIAGALLAIFYLAGRFSLCGDDQRTVDEILLYDIRVWTLLGLAGVALIYSPPRFQMLQRGQHVSARLAPVMALLIPSYVAISSLWTIDFDSSIVKAMEAAILTTACFCIVPFIQAGQAAVVRHWFWVWLVLATGLMCIMGCFLVSDSTRMSVLGGGPNTFGRNMGLLFLGLLYLQRRRPTTKPWLWYPLMALSLLMVVLSGSRGALLATSVGGILYLLIDNRYRMRNVVAVGSFLIVIPAIMLSTEMGERAFEMFETRILNQTFEQQHMSGREDLYSAAYELGLERPWFGHGLSGFTILLDMNYPHNIVLELFCETGIVGVVMLVLLLLSVLMFVIRHRCNCEPAVWGAFGLTLSSAMFSGDFFDSRGIFLIAMLGSQELVAVRSIRPRAIVRKRRAIAIERCAALH